MNKKVLLYFIIFMISSLITSAADLGTMLHFQFSNGDVYMNTTMLTGTNITCKQITASTGETGIDY
jgi:hypothetical protein